jgi:hypothetical protein
VAGKDTGFRRDFGKALTFVGVMFLVIGLVGGDAGASNPGNGKGKDNAPGQVKKHDDVAASAGATADASANGDCGAYCSTSDGTPSGNGNGDGNANGKPCAGCVGNADDKNPPGQANDGSDHNNGYECDGNSGVGKTNPAHSGCKPTTTTAPPQTTTTVAQQTTTTVAQQTTTTVAGGTTTTVAVGGSTTVPADVLGVQFTRGDESPRALASTGAGFMRPFTLMGALLLLVGVALMIIRVRPTTVRS